MKKLSDYRDEEALDLLADLLEPVVEILADKDVKDSFSKGNKVGTVSTMIKNHKKAVLTILAILSGEDVNNYHCSIFDLPVRILEVLNDEELLRFFGSQVQMLTASGSATETTEGTEEK